VKLWEQFWSPGNNYETVWLSGVECENLLSQSARTIRQPDYRCQFGNWQCCSVLLLPLSSENAWQLYLNNERHSWCNVHHIKYTWVQCMIQVHLLCTLQLNWMLKAYWTGWFNSVQWSIKQMCQFYSEEVQMNRHWKNVYLNFMCTSWTILGEQAISVQEVVSTLR
jgi:hypothetical protein